MLICGQLSERRAFGDERRLVAGPWKAPGGGVHQAKTPLWPKGNLSTEHQVSHFALRPPLVTSRGSSRHSHAPSCRLVLGLLAYSATAPGMKPRVDACSLAQPVSCGRRGASRGCVNNSSPTIWILPPSRVRGGGIPPHALTCSSPPWQNLYPLLTRVAQRCLPLPRPSRLGSMEPSHTIGAHQRGELLVRLQAGRGGEN